MDLRRLAAGELLVPAGAPAPVEFAATELGGYLERLVGAAPTRRPVAGPPGSWLCLAAPGGDVPERALAMQGAEGLVRPADDTVVLAGVSPRALVTTVYALLEALGCRWSPRGRDDEALPPPERVPARPPALTLAPPFARRAYAADLATWHSSVPERLAARLPADLAFVDWMAKTGATGFLFIRHANDLQWTIPELLPALSRRGLALETGGHALVELLPRELFASAPELFPEDAHGRRTDLGNLCVSSPAALDVVCERARSARAGADEFHLWGLDLLGGGWCRCPGCRSLGPSDQALTVSNHVADDGGPRIFHLAYHDTLEAPRHVRPSPGVWAEFAPRERCYGHALDDPACRTNGRYRRALENHLERFAGRVHAFEYYGDAILFGGCAVPLGEVIERDLECYRRAGVGGVSCLVFGAYSLWAYGLNVELFAQATLDPAGLPRARPRYCARVGGPRAPALSTYLGALERLMAGVVTQGDVLLPPRRGTAALRAADRLDAALVGMETLVRLAADTHPAEVALLDYSGAALAAVHAAVRDRITGAPAVEVAPGFAEALAQARRLVHAIGPRIAGTWGLHDLELVHGFYAAALAAD